MMSFTYSPCLLMMSASVNMPIMAPVLSSTGIPLICRSARIRAASRIHSSGEVVQTLWVIMSRAIIGALLPKSVLTLETSRLVGVTYRSCDTMKSKENDDERYGLLTSASKMDTAFHQAQTSKTQNVCLKHSAVDHTHRWKVSDIPGKVRMCNALSGVWDSKSGRSQILQ